MNNICNEFEKSTVILDELKGLIASQSDMISAVEQATLDQGYVSHYEFGKTSTEDEQHDQNAFDAQFGMNMEDALTTQTYSEFIDDYSNNVSLAREMQMDLEVLNVECSVSVIGDINHTLQSIADDIEKVTHDIGNGLSP